MNFEIISVGTELLLGQIVNTNAQYLSRALSELGFNVFYTTVVGDNPQRLHDALKIASRRADAVITTGGLGPTGDDLTKETIAEFCGLKCVMHEESYQRLLERFKKSNSYMAQNNLKQAEMPEGCIVLKNDNGTAPGAIIEGENTIFIMLPGPPSEMKALFEAEVLPYLEQKAEAVIFSRSLRVFGLGESAIEEKLAELMATYSNPTLAPYAKIGEVELRLTAKAANIQEAEEMIKPLEKSIRENLGDMVYGVGDNVSMQEVVVEILREKNLKLTTAESCTGGLVAQNITSIPGASECFECGFVTYSNKKKTELLDVKAEILEKFGAVSEETALEMCYGAKCAAGADIAVSITGIAGPDGGSLEKPVGLVYIGICTNEIHKAYKFNFAGNRNVVRARTNLYALDLVRRTALGIIDNKVNYIW
ncbi:MAG: competence/damage-inducible protein A [Oscillospiraceae bacterium]